MSTPGRVRNPGSTKTWVLSLPKITLEGKKLVQILVGLEGLCVQYSRDKWPCNELLTGKDLKCDPLELSTIGNIYRSKLSITQSMIGWTVLSSRCYVCP